MVFVSTHDCRRLPPIPVRPVGRGDDCERRGLRQHASLQHVVDICRVDVATTRQHLSSVINTGSSGISYGSRAVRTFHEPGVQRNDIHQHPEPEFLPEQPPSLFAIFGHSICRIEEQFHRVVTWLSMNVDCAREIGGAPSSSQ